MSSAPGEDTIGERISGGSPDTMGENGRWFRIHVGRWHSTHARTFPWRTTDSAYAILIAELMLHRTQARQVEPVFTRFLERFPSLAAVAEANAEQIRQVLAPLGLGWRQANFIPLAGLLLDRFAGQVPSDRSALLSLPGVGPYVADAVRVFAFGQEAALVDTNTVRVAGRYFGFSTHAESRRRQAVRDAVGLLVDSAHSREANLALLDFAALVCRASRPACQDCPVAKRCAYATGQTAQCDS